MKATSAKEKIRRLLHLQPTLALVWQSGPLWIWASGVLVVVQGLLPLLSLYLMKLIVDAVTAALTTGGSQAFVRVGLRVGAIAVVSLVGVFCNALARFIADAQVQAVSDRVYDVLHAKSMAVDLEYYESPQYFDALHLAQRQAPSRPLAIVNGLGQFVQSGIALAGISGLLISFDWRLALILFAAAVPSVAVRFRYAETMLRWRLSHAPAERLSDYYSWLLTRDSHAKELRLFNLGRVFRARFVELRRQLRAGQMALAARLSLREFVVQVCATVAIYGSLALVAYRAINGRITLGDLVMYFQAFQRGQGFLKDLLGSLATIYENNLFVENFERFLKLPVKVIAPPQPRPVPNPLASGIVFEQVQFRYPAGTRPVLAEVSLRIAPGEHVALVGANGAGKTTLVKLLCRLYDPVAGRILVDGVDLRALSVPDWQRQINVVFQDYARYHLSARENVWLGNVDLPPDTPRVTQAAGLSGVDAVIRGLPQGYDTILGKWFQGGEELSMGEWQEVALARAFMRDAQIIILDEPTSALDADAEFQFFERFHALARGRTAFLISHRMSTVRMADRIVVLEEGRITEDGSHAALLRLGGTYARLFERQARNYR
jgi:ATP-binding cassette, subfamily B, bacterial